VHSEPILKVTSTVTTTRPEQVRWAQAILSPAPGIMLNAGVFTFDVRRAYPFPSSATYWRGAGEAGK
jgi:hypothetical protein